jgi:hypothetical protein
MATQIDNTFRSFSFASAISANLLVQADSTANAAKAAVSPAFAIGVVQEDVAAAGVGNVKLFHPTQFGTVSGTGITAGLVVKADASGKIVNSALTDGVVTVGIALANATDGDVVEFAPNFNV